MQALFDSTFLSADMSPWVANLIILFVKGFVVLAATWTMAYALRGSAAAIRFMVWSTGLLSLMLLPLLSSVFPAWELDLLPAAPVAEAPMVADSPAMSPWDAPVPAPPPVGADEPVVADVPAPAAAPGFFASLNFHWSTWAFGIWMLGLLVLVVRLALAHAGAALLVKKGDLIDDDDWHLLAERISNRLEIDRFVRLRKSAWTSVPMSVGIFRPTVVLPADADAWDEEKRNTVLFHELAHVKRKDCLVQLLTHITCALYWFNPLVWVAAWQLRIERERACDDLVINAGVDASSYAETLLQTARQIKKSEWSTLATVSMARQSQLEGRLLSILDSSRRRTLNRATVVLTITMIACMVVPLAIMQPARAQAVPAAPDLADVPDAPAPPDPVALPDFEIPDIKIPDIEIPEIHISDIDIPDIELPDIHIPPIHIGDMEFDFDMEPGADTSIDSLTIDQLIELRKYGVDAEFIQAIRTLGFQDVTYRQLLQAAKYGADERYITRMREAGYDGLELLAYARMSKYGVDPDFLASMERAGYSDLSAEELIDMSKYGVDEALVARLTAAGFDDLGVSDIIDASKYGVSSELIESLASAGYDDFSFREVIDASKYGVDGRLIASMRAYGYSNMSGSALIDASKYGVDGAYLESLRASGYTGLELDTIISMKKYGVDARYLSDMREIGIDADADELIRMRKYGVDAQYVKELMEAGIEEVSIDQLIDMRKHGVDADYIRSMRGN